MSRGVAVIGDRLDRYQVTTISRDQLAFRQRMIEQSRIPSVAVLSDRVAEEYRVAKAARR